MSNSALASILQNNFIHFLRIWEQVNFLLQVNELSNLNRSLVIRLPDFFEKYKNHRKIHRKFYHGGELNSLQRLTVPTNSIYFLLSQYLLLDHNNFFWIGQPHLFETQKSLQMAALIIFKGWCDANKETLLCEA